MKIVKNHIFALIVGQVFMCTASCQAAKMVVTVPVANMRTGPGAAPSGVVGPALSLDSKTPDTNIEQDSQLLMNDFVLVEEDDTVPAGWYKIQAIMQPGLVNGKWQGCSGFIQADQVEEASFYTFFNAVVKVPWTEVISDLEDKIVLEKLSLGTCIAFGPPLLVSTEGERYHSVRLASDIEGLIKESDCYFLNGDIRKDIDMLRASIVQSLLSFEASPYVWGGCSAYDPSNKAHLTGVDCSALVYLVMRSHGLLIPRNSHAQSLKSTLVALGADLKPGDLVYLCNKGRESMNHVLVFLGDEKFIETTGLGFSSVTETQNPEMLTTRIILSQDFFGCPVAALANNLEFMANSAGKEICKVMYLRTFLSCNDQVQQLYDNFCNALCKTTLNMY